jgi:hypothetical protein
MSALDARAAILNARRAQMCQQIRPADVPPCRRAAIIPSDDSVALRASSAVEAPEKLCRHGTLCRVL